LAEPRFEWYKDKAGKFRFRLVAPNGQTIAVGEAYESKEACIDAIMLMKRIVARTTVFESSIEEARYLMSTLEAEEFLLKVGQPVALGGEIIAQKSRNGTIVLYEVIE
jgi:hypothetical protein